MQRRWLVRLLFLVGIFVVGVPVFFLVTTLRQRFEPRPLVEDTRVPRRIDGVLVTPEEADARLVGVLIDGMVDGRPTVGLAQALFVWEVPVEGGITRYLALYPQTQIPEQVGPVRSLRPYFLDFAEEVGALLLHVGGSPEALTRAKTSTVERLNQFFDSVYFWRTAERRAPHNVLTSGYLVARALDERNLARTSDFIPWQYARDSALVPVGNGSGARVIYSTPPYTVEWRWSATRGRYERFLGGERHRDADGTGIDAANVIVQFVPIEILDSIGRRRIITEGEGDALILRRGSVLHAHWRKNARERTQFVNRDTGTPITFMPGVTWISIVPLKADVTALAPRDGELPENVIQ